MKSTGIVRKIDDLGRLVIPKETRRNLGIKEGDPVEFYVEDEKIIIQKFQRQCIFCGNQEDLKLVLDKPVCASCLDTIGKEKE
ncbi:AbrB/MazE/SpoVT family DNA-binding domain-containing protein [Clostridium formicaceticum]|uniref:AbrB family transcriptional regulator n=1 Tax=Clostridium formicaceticum TaxID=1497 RepID=A0AAC9WFR3_9CLOT|nr:AbrB/MazE/SpoVT family DNA-binding domain-containing protein [Clostridium formicaceticum]AOY76662.1 AbrB family transcriptional regulator [Clostridium formicaceticum]ARE87088.1 Transition state regulatory protein AbrB [Clostridium formicaceticum]